MLCMPLLQSINLLTSRKIVSTIHLMHTFWIKLLYYLHFFLIITSLPYNFVHSISSSWKALPSILCLISFWWNNFYPIFRCCLGISLLSTVVFQFLSWVWHFAIPWSATCQASLSFTISWSSETRVHWVDDAIQSSNPLLAPSPPGLNISQHQGLF